LTEPTDEHARERLSALRIFQELHKAPVRDQRAESPALALKTLNEAVDAAPDDYRDYLVEAVACYEGGLYRAAILMVWAASVEHLYIVAAAHHNGIRELQRANLARYGQSKNYREIKKKDDCLCVGEANWLQLAEDAGMINRNAKQVLTERLKVRNLCAHPTKYTVGREEAVVFIESLLLNVLGAKMLNW
jgi:hypothetical protein